MPPTPPDEEPVGVGATAAENPVASEVAETIEAAAEHRPPRRWLVRLGVAVVVLAALGVAGRRYYSELHRLRQAPPGLVLFIAALWLASRYPAADVMRVGLRALGHTIGRFEAFMLQMIQSYGNLVVPRAGIGMPALYLKLRHNVPFADLSAVQLLPMTLLQIFTIGVLGVLCQLVLDWRHGAPMGRPLYALFGAVAVGCVVPLLIPLPAGRIGRGRVTRFLARLATAWRRLGRSRPMLLRVVATHAVMLLLRAWRIQLCFAAVGHPVHYAGALVASLLADLAFVVSVTPAALGFREGAIVYAARVMNTTGDIALAAAVLDRVISTAVNVIVGQVGVWQLIRPLLRPASGNPDSSHAGGTTR